MEGLNNLPKVTQLISNRDFADSASSQGITPEGIICTECIVKSVLWRCVSASLALSQGHTLLQWIGSGRVCHDFVIQCGSLSALSELFFSREIF